jgi:hypothetical protein
VPATVGGGSCLISSGDGKTSVGGGSGLTVSGSDVAACESKGAESTAPSIKQKVNVSSKVRLHVGHLFIGLFSNGTDLKSERLSPRTGQGY